MGREQRLREGMSDKQRRMKVLLKTFGGKCWWCKCDVIAGIQNSDFQHQPNQATRDHIVPRSRGGTNALANLVLACRACNEERADRDARVWAAHLKLHGRCMAAAE